MIVGLDGPVVVVPVRAAVLLARPLERLVADAKRRGENVEPCILEVLADWERLRRALLAQSGSVSGTAEPDSAEPSLDRTHAPDLSTDDAADILGWSPSYLRRQARQHRIGIKVGTDWRFPVAEIVELREKRSVTR